MSIKSQFKEAILAHHPEQSREQILEKTVSSLARVGLEFNRERLGHFPYEFSGGQLQRVCAALALLHEPRLLIADEPTSSLDETAKSGLLDLLFSEQDRLGMAMILISHDTDELKRRCGRVLQLVDGALQNTVAPIESRQSKRARPEARVGRPLLVARNVSCLLYTSDAADE
mgnify:CR=1 FL=1